MRNMSFMLTTDQIRNRTKSVTRRLGWKNVKPGELIQAVVKGQGIKKGEKVEKLAIIRVKASRQEAIQALLDDRSYGRVECAREGFLDSAYADPYEFVRFFCRSHNRCTPETVVTRIEFEYIDP